MLPLFKSHYSIGRSILTLDDPKKVVENGADSIFKIAKDNELKSIVLVEDSLTGFFEAYKRSIELKLKLVFGLRLSMRNSAFPDDEKSEHKAIIFAKNANGCKSLNKIYSEAFTEFGGYLDFSSLKNFWNENDLKLCVPFYDSFLHVNLLNFGNCVPDFTFCNPSFLLEDNDVSYDHLLQDAVQDFCAKNNYPIVHAKSIYYNLRKDVKAFQTYKIICNRTIGKERTLDKPELSHFCSDQFCFESWKESINNE